LFVFRFYNRDCFFHSFPTRRSSDLELLFRGVLQTTFGYIPASVIFALVHVRYLSKPVLLISVLLISFFIGYLFEVTGNLYVTILDRKSTRLNSSHVSISYAVFCLNK